MKAEPSKSKATTKVTASAAKAAAAAEVPVKTAVRTAPKAAPVAPAAAAPVDTTPSALQTPVRSTRPSSRLAQLTVPSIAQSSTSSAAKAIYTNTMPSTILVPNPANALKKDAKLANNWKTKPVDELSDAEELTKQDNAYMKDKQT